MHLTKDRFDDACRAAALPPTQSATLWTLLQRTAPSHESPPKTSRFDLAHLAYYFGAFVVLGAMGWYLTTAWENFGGRGIFAIAAIYGVVFAALGREFWRREAWGLCTPGGLLMTLAVGMVPLTVYGLERWFGWWPQEDPGNYAGFHVWINGGWIVMELATILIGALALWFMRFPFLTAPVAFACWYLSMDATPLLFGRNSWMYQEQLLVSLYFGLAMLASAYLVDVRRRWQGPDYGFWLSFFGLLAFWGGLSLMKSDSELGKLGYAGINVLLMAAGVVLDRRACVVFGALGVCGYLGYLAYHVFQDSLVFPFALTAVGLLIIGLGVLYQRRRRTWREKILRVIPERYRRLVPAMHASASA